MASNVERPFGEVDISTGCYPYGFLRELKGLFTLAWPTSLSILFHYLIQPISLMFCGHLGKVQLASAAMAISVIYITTVSIGRGLAFGGDTFFAQVYGSKNKKKVGVYLQRGFIFGFLACFPIWTLLLNTENLLLLTGQDPDVARNAQEYCQLFMPGALAYCWLFTVMRYLLCQNRVIPNLIICIVSCGVNALLHYGLVYQADMGIKGSAVSLAMTYYLVLILLISYIWGSGIYKETWAGWSWECLEEWGAFCKVAVSSIFMTFLFWLCTEVGTFLSGLLGEEDISAFSIAFQVEGFAWMVPLGVGGACTARIGQYLGANEPLGAITSCRVALTVQVAISLVMAGACYGLRYYIPVAFTTNSDLINYTGATLQIVAIFLLLEGFGGVGVGIVRGTGRQTLGAIIIFISYYVVALPVGVPLMFATHLGLFGLWWGFVLGLGIQDVFLLAFVGKVNWVKEAEKAQERAGINKEETSINTSEPVQDDSQPDETTGLLVNASLNASHNYTPPNLSRLILKRLIVFLVFACILGAGVLVRMYVHVTARKPFTELCIPVNTTTQIPFDNESIAANVTAVPWTNYTLPYCNDTDTGPLVTGNWPFYPVWL